MCALIIGFCVGVVIDCWLYVVCKFYACRALRAYICLLKGLLPACGCKRGACVARVAVKLFGRSIFQRGMSSSVRDWSC